MDPSSESREYPTVAVVGVGLIGGSLAIALRRAGFAGTVLGVSQPRSLETARRLGAIDEGFPYEQLVDAASRADLVVLSSPITAILEHLRTLGRAGDRLKPGTVVTDVGSTKAEILRTATEALPPEVRFVGGHPLAGSEQSGVQAADPFLFQNAYYVLTPAPGIPGEETDRLAGLLSRTGARVAVLSADVHDRVAAAISHVPQLLAVALVDSLGRLGEHRETATRLAAGGFRDMTRIASSPWPVWRDILGTNRQAVKEAAGHLLEGVQDLLGNLDEEDGLAPAFERAARTRAEIPADTRGFLSRLWDVLVEVADEPGTIVGLSAPLAEKGISIKDIEVLKVREGEGGTMRLAFETRELALEALEELRRRGFRARLRE